MTRPFLFETEFAPLAPPDLSVVLPMKNEARNLAALFDRLVPVLTELGLAYEIIAVDDGSGDDTLARLKAMRLDLPELKIVSLSRNFGKEIGVAAGLARASGRAVVLMDSDLQHPPEAIPDLVGPWRRGEAKIVAAERVDLDRGSGLRALGTHLFYKAFDLFSEVRIDPRAGDFMVLDRIVVDAFLAMPERHRFNRGILAWAGFKRLLVPVRTEKRSEGSSRWGFGRLAQLAMTAIMSFGTLPLRIWTYIGLAVSAVAFLYGIEVVGRTLAYGVDVPGYASLIVVVLFMGGLQLIGLGIIGQYLGNVFSEVKRRPLYFEEETVGFDTPPPPRAVVGDDLTGFPGDPHAADPERSVHRP